MRLNDDAGYGKYVLVELPSLRGPSVYSVYTLESRQDTCVGRRMRRVHSKY
jgi:hypothetical protein